MTVGIYNFADMRRLLALVLIIKTTCIDVDAAFHLPPQMMTRMQSLTTDIRRSPLCMQSTNEECDRRSIGDYVKGVHGGKYQFEETTGGGGLTSVGSEFAQSLYATSSSCETSVGNNGLIDPTEELPKWAQGLRDVDITDEQLSCDGEIQVGDSIQIRNDERTWETFYAFVLSSSKVGVIPETGSLAPRGGANSVGDKDKPYSDSAILNIVETGEQSGVDNDESNCTWLIVGTEEATWKYRIVL